MTEVLYENCFATSVGYDMASTPPVLFLLFHERNSIMILSADEELETELSNGIKIYGDGEAT